MGGSSRWDFEDGSRDGLEVHYSEVQDSGDVQQGSSVEVQVRQDLRGPSGDGLAEACLEESLAGPEVSSVYLAESWVDPEESLVVVLVGCESR